MSNDRGSRAHRRGEHDTRDPAETSRFARRSLYGLSFGSQLVVWATRRRLHVLARGVDDTDVGELFGLAGLGAAFATLMRIIDLLLCGAGDRIQLHAVACPSLAPHEACLLNALAFLQQGAESDSRRCFSTLAGETMFGLALPALRSIAEDLAAQGMKLSFVDAASLAGAAPRGTVH